MADLTDTTWLDHGLSSSSVSLTDYEVVSRPSDDEDEYTDYGVYGGDFDSTSVLSATSSSSDVNLSDRAAADDDDTTDDYDARLAAAADPANRPLSAHRRRLSETNPVRGASRFLASLMAAQPAVPYSGGIADDEYTSSVDGESDDNSDRLVDSPALSRRFTAKADESMTNSNSTLKMPNLGTSTSWLDVTSTSARTPAADETLGRLTAAGELSCVAWNRDLADGALVRPRAVKASFPTELNLVGFGSDEKAVMDSLQFLASRIYWAAPKTRLHLYFCQASAAKLTSKSYLADARYSFGLALDPTNTDDPNFAMTSLAVVYYSTTTPQLGFDPALVYRLLAAHDIPVIPLSDTLLMPSVLESRNWHLLGSANGPYYVCNSPSNYPGMPEAPVALPVPGFVLYDLGFRDVAALLASPRPRPPVLLETLNVEMPGFWRAPPTWKQSTSNRSLMALLSCIGLLLTAALHQYASAGPGLVDVVYPSPSLKLDLPSVSSAVYSTPASLSTSLSKESCTGYGLDRFLHLLSCPSRGVNLSSVEAVLTSDETRASEATPTTTGLIAPEPKTTTHLTFDSAALFETVIRQDAILRNRMSAAVSKLVESIDWLGSSLSQLYHWVVLHPIWGQTERYVRVDAPVRTKQLCADSVTQGRMLLLRAQRNAYILTGRATSLIGALREQQLKVRAVAIAGLVDSGDTLLVSSVALAHQASQFLQWSDVVIQTALISATQSASIWLKETSQWFWLNGQLWTDELRRAEVVERAAGSINRASQQIAELARGAGRHASEYSERTGKVITQYADRAGKVAAEQSAKLSAQASHQAAEVQSHAAMYAHRINIWLHSQDWYTYSRLRMDDAVVVVNCRLGKSCKRDKRASREKKHCTGRRCKRVN